MSTATVMRDAAGFLDVSEHLLAEGYHVRFSAAGTSMQPTIANGDAITVAPVAVADLQRGDIVLYRSEQRVIAHRVVDISATGSEIAAFLLRGDAKAACDGPVAPGQILGKVIAIERRGGAAIETWCARLARVIFRRAGTLRT
jgi:signal peptidase I